MIVMCMSIDSSTSSHKACLMTSHLNVTNVPSVKGANHINLKPGNNAILSIAAKRDYFSTPEPYDAIKIRISD